MTTIDLTPAELELIQAKRIEAEKVQAEKEARSKQEIADRTATYQKALSGKVTIAKRNLDLMRNNWNAMLSTTKGNTTWKWSTVTKTIEEVVRVYDRTINDYVTHDTLTATIEIATLTNGNVTIQCQDNQFVSNISKDRSSRWNPNPKPTISSYTSGRSYTSLKKCVAVAEELMEELVAAAQSAASKKNVMQQAVEALKSRYTDATIAITTEWDRTNHRDRERVRVQLSNGVSMMVDPWMNAEGVLSYAVGTVNFGALKGVDILTALNGIAI